MLVSHSISKLRRIYYTFVNRMLLYRKTRWTATLICVFFYFQTAAQVSFDVVTYLIGFYLLQLLVSYLTPRGVTGDIEDRD
jgi:Rer1 family